MNIDFLSFCRVCRMGEGATGAIALFSGPQGVLLLLADISSRRRRAYPEDRKNARSRLPNCSFQVQP
jgi:hypothetical protein